MISTKDKLISSVTLSTISADSPGSIPSRKRWLTWRKLKPKKMQSCILQFDETKTLLIKEQEVAKKASEEVAMIKEVSVVDTALADRLKEENEKLKADMEEAKALENAKLQSALQEMREQLDETKAMLVKEQEAANIASEGAHAIQECPVIDTSLMDKLNDVEAKTQENAKLHAALQEMRQQLDETNAILVKEQEAAKKASEGAHVIQAFPIIDTSLMGKLNDEEAWTQENAKLQAALQEMRQQLDETKAMLVKEQEAAKKASEGAHAIQEFPVIDTTFSDKLNDEEAKTQENAKLRSALQEMQQLDETKAMLVKEQEACKNASEGAYAIQEFPVIDSALMDKLNDENEKLKALVNSLERKINEAEKKYEETSMVSEERLKKELDAESKIIDLNKAMQSLKKKVSETEEQTLRQKALLHSPANRMLGYLSIPSTPTKHSLENGHHRFGDAKESHSAPPSFFAKSDSKLRRSYIERQHEYVDALIHCVNQNIGFSEGKPVAAFTTYKCLLHWKSFEAEKTSVFDRLIQMIGSAIENEENNDHLAYWLSNTSTLLFLLQRSLKTSATGKPPPPTSLFGRMTQGFRSSSANLSVEGLDVVRQVDAKYPALLFKQQLTAYVEKIYGIIRDNIKKDLTSLLPSCIQAPRKWAAVRGAGRSIGSQTQTTPWDGIIQSLNNLLKTLQENHVPPVLVQKIFNQIFSFINVQLFNSLLLRRECCSFSNGEYVKSGLDSLDLWCGQAKTEYPGFSWDELTHIKQAVGFLVIFQKYRISYDDIVNDLCPILSVQQLYRICTQYWDDKYNTQSVSPSVLSSMKELTETESDDPASNSFLLDDNSSIPFSVDDISSSLQLKEFAHVKHASELLENPAFQFLLE